jgi:hypothetical protein
VRSSHFSSLGHMMVRFQLFKIFKFTIRYYIDQGIFNIYCYQFLSYMIELAMLLALLCHWKQHNWSVNYVRKLKCQPCMEGAQ